MTKQLTGPPLHFDCTGAGAVMPNFAFHIDAMRMPSDEALAALSRDCVELCTPA
ncbi:hypothetical protein QZM62_08505 [Burkholderia multivorans]|uniref:hypothetical protein n=1 Tax=Burkholderia multivorans TaxID=87883 RepID=UPI0021C13672|nr:hypothetical protein [Burkholderia multivorans]MDN7653481.1 hypothetical protein [Burkholderia multivorans]